MSMFMNLRYKNMSQFCTSDKEYFEREDVCRFCWSLGSELDLFTQNNEQGRTEFIKKVQDYLNIDLYVEMTEQPIYPKKVCFTCYNKIEEFFSFKEFCQETDRKLKEIFLRNNSDVKHELSEEISTEEVEPNSPSLENDAIISPPNSPKHESNYTEKPDNHALIISPPNSPKHELTDMEKTDNHSLKKPEKKTNKYITKRSSTTYCTICCVDYQSVDTLTTHKSEAHGIESDGLFKCFGCDRKYKCRRARMTHEINFCKGLKSGYKCSICNVYLPLRRKYETHMRQHRTKAVSEMSEFLFKCAKCHKTFKTKDSWREHMNGYAKNYVCETCGRVFSRADYLLVHARSHADDRRYACTRCDFRCTQKSTLNIHIRRHTGERPYACDVCPQRCVTSSNLQAHRRRHLGINNHQCQICSKKFGYKLSLAEHMESFHEQPQSHPCPHCGATYTRARGLRRHLRTKHGIDYKNKNQGVSDANKKELTHQDDSIPDKDASGLKDKNESDNYYVEIDEGNEKYLCLPKDQYQVVVIEEVIPP